MNPSNQPNILWIFGDQHRRQMLSVAGDPNVRTPNIDQLAEYGARFTRAYANFPLCCPARATLVTGRHAHHVVPGHVYRFPDGQQTIAHVLAENGYRTAWFGKWHLEGRLKPNGKGGVDWDIPPRHPDAPADEVQRECFDWIAPERRGGFETWVGYENNNSPHNTWVHGHDENGKEVGLHRLNGFETDVLSDYVIDYLKARAAEKQTGAGRPFFCALSVQPPHDPYGAPSQFMQNYNPARMALRGNVPPVDWVQERARREYAGACALVENLDWNLGRIRAALRELDLDKETLIIFFSDHGDMHGSHGLFHKTNPYEESTGIPLIIGGGLDVQGRSIRMTSQEPVSLVDLAPTTLGLCGITKPEWMQGFDFSHLRAQRKGKDKAPEGESDSVFLQCVVPTYHPDSTDRPWRGLVTRDGWKYICFENTDWLMFDLNTDPLEQVNLAHNTAFRERRQQLRDRLKQWITDTGDTFAVP